MSIPVHDSLANCVWGYRIPVVHFVSPYVSPTGYCIPYRLDDYAATIKSKRLCEQSRVLEEWGAIPMATLRREGVSDSVTTHRREEINGRSAKDRNQRR